MGLKILVGVMACKEVAQEVFEVGVTEQFSANS